MGRFFLATFLIILLPLETFARVGFLSLLPNPSGDDTLGEYIDIRNVGCESVDISGYTLADASGKTYTLPAGTSIMSHETQRYAYQTTKISLNNSGDESVTLRDAGGGVIDQVNYSGTQKDDVVLSFSLADDDCTSTNTGTDTGTDTGTGAGTGTGTNDTSSGTVTDSGSVLIPEDTHSGSIDGGSGSTDSGTIIVLPGEGSGSTSSGSISTGSLMPPSDTLSGSTASGTVTGSGSSGSGGSAQADFTLDTLQYADTDNNKKIDTLIVTYSHILTGIVNTGSIALYSNTGGLSSTRINTLSGLIRDVSLSGNTLFLHLIEGDIEKVSLRITNTTSSDLRLKTLVPMGFTSIYGQAPPDFLLTSSFDNYRSASALTSGTQDTSSGALESMSGGTMTGVVFPEIVLTLQNYTNTTLSGDTITCTTSPCRMNFTLEPIFTGGFLERDYTCSVRLAGDIYESCNPPQLYPLSSGSLDITLVHKASGSGMTRAFLIFFDIKNTSTQSSQNPISPPSTNRQPVAIIEMDGKWKSSFATISENTLECLADTCGINLTAENSYDPDGDEIRFLWIFPDRTASFSRDPGSRTFGLGTHVIILRVIDRYEAYTEVRYTLEVRGKPPKEEKISQKKEKVQKSTSSQSGDSQTSSKALKKSKKQKGIDFFDPPTILLQNPKKVQSQQDGYFCHTRTKTCSLNLSLSGAEKGIQYIWIYPDGSEFISKNPRSQSFAPGEHTLRLRAVYSGSSLPLWEREIAFTVVRDTVKKRAKSKTTGSKISPSPKTSISPKELTKDVQDIQHTQEGMGMDTLLFLIFLCIFMGVFLLRFFPFGTHIVRRWISPRGV